MGSASVFDFSLFGNRFSVVSLSRRINPLYFNVFFGVVRLYEVSVDNNISWNGSLSDGGVVSGLDWLIFSRKGSSDIVGRIELNFFSVVYYMRFDEGSSVNLISVNVDCSSNSFVFVFGWLSYNVSFNKLVFLLNVYWV